MTRGEVRLRHRNRNRDRDRGRGRGRERKTRGRLNGRRGGGYDNDNESDGDSDLDFDLDWDWVWVCRAGREGGANGEEGETLVLPWGARGEEWKVNMRVMNGSKAARLEITILGAGSWGTAMALHLVRRGHGVTLAARRPEQAARLRAEGENGDYLPGVALPGELRVAAWEDSGGGEPEVVVLACPAAGMRELARHCGKRYGGAAAFLSLAKGLDPGSLLAPYEVLQQELPGRAAAVLSGPNFALEVAWGKPTAAVLAGSGEGEERVRLQEAFSSETFRVYTSDDPAGVEWCGCLKNVYALAAGICDGLRLGENAKAALLTRSLHEMSWMVQALGGTPATVYGLSGFGDLVATSYGPHSRNRGFGEEIGRGARAEELLAARKTVVEGYWTCRNFHEKCRALGLAPPILGQIYQVLYEGKEPLRALVELMTRQLKAERPPGVGLADTLSGVGSAGAGAGSPAGAGGAAAAEAGAERAGEGA